MSKYPILQERVITQPSILKTQSKLPLILQNIFWFTPLYFDSTPIFIIEAKEQDP
jgi:hypothetical protein